MNLPLPEQVASAVPLTREESEKLTGQMALLRTTMSLLLYEFYARRGYEAQGLSFEAFVEKSELSERFAWRMISRVNMTLWITGKTISELRDAMNRKHGSARQRLVKPSEYDLLSLLPPQEWKEAWEEYLATSRQNDAVRSPISHLHRIVSQRRRKHEVREEPKVVEPKRLPTVTYYGKVVRHKDVQALVEPPKTPEPVRLPLCSVARLPDEGYLVTTRLPGGGAATILVPFDAIPGGES